MARRSKSSNRPGRQTKSIFNSSDYETGLSSYAQLKRRGYLSAQQTRHRYGTRGINKPRKPPKGAPPFEWWDDQRYRRVSQAEQQRSQVRITNKLPLDKKKQTLLQKVLLCAQHQQRENKRRRVLFSISGGNAIKSPGPYIRNKVCK